LGRRLADLPHDERSSLRVCRERDVPNARALRFICKGACGGRRLSRRDVLVLLPPVYPHGTSRPPARIPNVSRRYGSLGRLHSAPAPSSDRAIPARGSLRVLSL